MSRSPQFVVCQRFLIVVCVTLIAMGSTLPGQTSVRHVKVLGGKDVVEIEVEASDRLVPETRVLTGPDRLVVDFPNAVPGAELRSQSVNRGQVKDVRVGLFQANPPVTRVVLDLKTAQSYQVFPYGRTVMIKVMGNAPDTSAGVEDFPPEPTRPGLVVANYMTGSERIRVDTSPAPVLDVSYRDGLLAIRASKVTLSEVLNAVQQRTGADIGIAPGADQEKVVVDLAPGPAPEVLARLLNGSRFNFLILNSASNPRQLDRVILSPRGAAVLPPPRVAQDDNSVDEPPTPVPAQMQPPIEEPPPSQIPPRPQAEIKSSPADDDMPDQ